MVEFDPVKPPCFSANPSYLTRTIQNRRKPRIYWVCLLNSSDITSLLRCYDSALAFAPAALLLVCLQIAMQAKPFCNIAIYFFIAFLMVQYINLSF